MHKTNLGSKYISGATLEQREIDLKLLLSKMIKEHPKLYDTISETLGFAYDFNCLCLLAQHPTKTIQEIHKYLRTGKL